MVDDVAVPPPHVVAGSYEVLWLIPGGVFALLVLRLLQVNATGALVHRC